MVMALGYDRARASVMDYRISKPAAYEAHRATFQSFFASNLVGVTDAVKQANIQAAKELSHSLLYHLQHEAPRADGSTAYPAPRLRPDVSGTIDGIAKAPYVRRARRMIGLGRIHERHIGVDNRVKLLGKPRHRAQCRHVRRRRRHRALLDRHQHQPRHQRRLPSPADRVEQRRVGRRPRRLLRQGQDHPKSVRTNANALAAFQTHLRAEGVQTHWPTTTRNQWLRPSFGA